jgi:chorismate synthase
MSEVDVQIERAKSLEDYQACVQLQKEVWGPNESRELVGVPLLLTGNRYGGSLLVAEDSGGHVVGFSFALLCQRPDGLPFWWSHITAVTPDRQGMDIGFRLKTVQRQEALAQGIREIRWAFDILEPVNAHFSIRKLGAVARRLEENFYGRTNGLLSPALATDCLLAEWHLDSPRVTDRLSGSAGLILRDLDALQRVFRTTDNHPQAPSLDLVDSPVLMEIPRSLDAITVGERELAMEWQDTLRTACRRYFGRGYAITDFILVEGGQDEALYVLEKTADS